MRENIKDSLKHFLFEIFETSYLSIIVIWIIYTFIAVPETVFGPSMEPTFYTGERVLVERILKNFKTFDRGEVVVLRPENENRDFIKRVIAVEGDIIKILGCKVFIYREGVTFALEEPYLALNTCTVPGRAIQEGRSLQLKDDEYVVMGDNRENSNDSRNFGFVTQKDIKGKVIARFWPLDKFEIF